MTRFAGALVLTGFVACLGAPVRADGGGDASAVVDKAIKALGGAEKLGAIKAATWKTKGTITIGGDDNKFNGEATIQGHDHFRNDFKGEFMGMPIMGSTVLAGDKGWRKFNDMVSELDKDAIANEKRNVYLQMAPMVVLPLKSSHFKLEATGEDKVDGKAAVVLKVTGPDGKDFKIFFDKESGLPVKTAAMVVGFQGDEATQETTYGNYKDFDGIKKATKIDTKRGGDKFLSLEMTEFKVLSDVDPKTFAEPK
jgi:hypothetical protein